MSTLAINKVFVLMLHNEHGNKIVDGVFTTAQKAAETGAKRLSRLRNYFKVKITKTKKSAATVTYVCSKSMLRDLDSYQVEELKTINPLRVRDKAFVLVAELGHVDGIYSNLKSATDVVLKRFDKLIKKSSENLRTRVRRVNRKHDERVAVITLEVVGIDHDEEYYVVESYKVK